MDKKYQVLNTLNIKASLENDGYYYLYSDNLGIYLDRSGIGNVKRFKSKSVGEKMAIQWVIDYIDDIKDSLDNERCYE